jgi:hypothetical protein
MDGRKGREGIIFEKMTADSLTRQVSGAVSKDLSTVSLATTVI